MEKTLTDEQLMEAVRGGELNKASQLFDRYHKHLYNFFVKITMDKDLGHDLTQNVFMRMIHYKHTYQTGAVFKSWIFRIARNIYADHYRKNRMMFSDDNLEIMDRKMTAIDDQMVEDERQKLLYIALYKLKPEQKEILMLSKFQKLKYEEIASIYETSVGAIKTKVHRALGKLKENYLELEKI
ncbi:RNA polymerase sigma factor [Fulvivirga lutimaris]|uniref:RNA polymerase sigma factor n=1 Tax=Fulvivirga lutimaris TaxID=1819566 RepID=UPI0031B5C337